MRLPIVSRVQLTAFKSAYGSCEGLFHSRREPDWLEHVPGFVAAHARVRRLYALHAHGLFICLWAKVEFIEAKCCGLKSLRRRVLQVTLRLLVGTRFDLCSRASFYQGVWAKIWQIARGCSKLCEGQGMPGNMPAQTDLSQYPGCRCPVIFGLFQNNTVATL